jgi:hypothetical protein
MIQQKLGIFMPEFSSFVPYMKENFLKNEDSILNFLNSQKDVNKYFIKTRIYSMSILIDYPLLLNDFLECKTLL